MLLAGILLIVLGLMIVVNKLKKISNLQTEDETYLLIGFFSIIVGIFSLLHVVIYG